MRDRVLNAAADVLTVERAALEGLPGLDTLPTYSSFKVMEIVDRVERELDVELDPDDLVPANLLRLDALCRTFRRAQKREIAR
ncbi:hypothetical protein [Actinokineospora sp. UTMC 2448]|uniref:hypothetical protein n=1 Tax=Actinokineospora sp. UTMC 2448 TaxID=2268449 RepID=UPI002164CF35|nr:hypothetical protein [Actinokineospora sp. UTMC 2448]